MIRRLLPPCALVVQAALSAACATAAVQVPGGGATEQHYFGYVRVVRHATSSTPVSVSDVRALGLRVGGGLGVGYLRDRQLVVPLDCRVVFLVEDQPQIDHAARLAAQLPTEGRCVVLARQPLLERKELTP